MTIPTLFHPNVYPTGIVCLSLLDEVRMGDDSQDTSIIWRPSLSIGSVLLGLKLVLEEPNINSPANVDASVMFRR